jgi:hypothetical protein
MIWLEDSNCMTGVNLSFLKERSSEPKVALEIAGEGIAT